MQKHNYFRIAWFHTHIRTYHNFALYPRFQQNSLPQGCHIWTLMGSNWRQIGQIWNFLRSVFCAFWVGHLALKGSVFDPHCKHLCLCISTETVPSLCSWFSLSFNPVFMSSYMSCSVYGLMIFPSMKISFNLQWFWVTKLFYDSINFWKANYLFALFIYNLDVLIFYQYYSVFACDVIAECPSCIDSTFQRKRWNQLFLKDPLKYLYRKW